MYQPERNDDKNGDGVIRLIMVSQSGLIREWKDIVMSDPFAPTATPTQQLVQPTVTPAQIPPTATPTATPSAMPTATPTATATVTPPPTTITSVQACSQWLEENPRCLEVSGTGFRTVVVGDVTVNGQGTVRLTLPPVSYGSVQVRVDANGPGGIAIWSGNFSVAELPACRSQYSWGPGMGGNKVYLPFVAASGMRYPTCKGGDVYAVPAMEPGVGREIGPCPEEGCALVRGANSTNWGVKTVDGQLFPSIFGTFNVVTATNDGHPTLDCRGIENGICAEARAQRQGKAADTIGSFRYMQITAPDLEKVKLYNACITVGGEMARGGTGRIDVYLDTPVYSTNGMVPMTPRLASPDPSSPSFSNVLMTAQAQVLLPMAAGNSVGWLLFWLGADNNPTSERSLRFVSSMNTWPIGGPLLFLKCETLLDPNNHVFYHLRKWIYDEAGVAMPPLVLSTVTASPTLDLPPVEEEFGWYAATGAAIVGAGAIVYHTITITGQAIMMAPASMLIIPRELTCFLDLTGSGWAGADDCAYVIDG